MRGHSVGTDDPEELQRLRVLYCVHETLPTGDGFDPFQSEFSVPLMNLLLDFIISPGGVFKHLTHL